MPKEIQHIAQFRGLGAINLGVGAVCAGHRRKTLVLNVKYLRKHAARRSELVGLKTPVAAFDALPVSVFHEMLQ